MFDIAEDQGDSARIKQLSVFLPNRVGALLGVTRSLNSVAIRILALSIADAADHAVARLVVDQRYRSAVTANLHRHAVSDGLKAVPVRNGSGAVP